MTVLKKEKKKEVVNNQQAKFLFQEQNGKCSICGIETFWNNKVLVFICDHIDGNSDNNKRNNLRMVCPNCDSQLPTYKSRNKNSKRTNRKNYYSKKNKSKDSG